MRYDGTRVAGAGVHRLRRITAMGALLVTAAACGGDTVPEEEGAPEGPSMTAAGNARTPLIELWTNDIPAFGVFVPGEGEPGAVGPDGERLPPTYTVAGGERLAQNPLLDFVFLNLESSYDVASVSAIAEGLGSSSAVSDKTLLVRIPPISADGAETARSRIAEALAAGADGITIPHVRSADEARTAVSFFEEMGADVWSPANPEGTLIVMLMIEDPGALAEAEAIADVSGYSVLACGIGSLTQALGDAEAGEAGNMRVLREADRVGLPDMITANAETVARRIDEGFLGLLMSGADANAHIEVGRAAAGR